MSAPDYTDWIDRTETRSDLISPFPARALAALAQAPTVPEKGDDLPPGWQWLYFLDTPSPEQTGPDGHPRRGGFLPPITLERRMWAAGGFEIIRPLTIGEPAERTSRIVSITPKSGASGEMIFVVLEHLIHQAGELRLREDQTLVYRAMPTGPTEIQPPATPPPGDWSASAPTDPATLFRFSALTYNGHRIHYDAAYARDVEHYPALVVHGPFLATLLLNLVAHNRPDASVRRFEFRAVSPIFSGDGLKLHGSAAAEGAELWACSDRGLGMRASVSFRDGGENGDA